jgi:hypothetical protein
MMFNRTIEFKVVKPNKEEDPKALTDEEYLQRWVHAAAFARACVYDASKLVAGYIVLDTFRKTMIAKAAKACCDCRL